MATAEATAGAGIEVVYCPRPGVTDLVALPLDAGATLADAVRASGLLERHRLVLEGLPLGLWGRRADAATLLRDGDRVEIYRPLLVDPKEARRLRYKRQRAAKPPSGTPKR